MVSGAFEVVCKPAGVNVSAFTSSFIGGIKVAKTLPCAVKNFH